MEYNPVEIEKKWQEKWKNEKPFRAEDNSSKPKYYVLDMFPYPSGAGLHVGHPLGYIASDIISRLKRLQGFNVLHPMGYDSFGLPAEQYAIQTGQHPAVTTEKNIARYREQLDRIGFSFDWDREVRTSDPDYYKWTQWIFIQLYKSWYNPRINKAENIDTLIAIFETEGFNGDEHDILTGDIEKDLNKFTPGEWKKFDERTRQEVLMHFRLAYLSEAFVNWCPALGTVLANDEVKDGVSERGGHPVERKRMKQWSMRITTYAQRLLDGLNEIDWSESIKEAQRNWIGKSEGCSIGFKVEGLKLNVEVFTTRPDTLFGVSYLTLAPELDLVMQITTPEQKEKVEAYVAYAKNRSERERQADVKNISGEFTGAYAIHPFTNEKIPVWVGDYVLAGYGTGAVMAVPAHDSRDFSFAKHFGLPIKQVVELPNGFDLNAAAYEEKSGKVINSDFLNGLEVKAAIKKCIKKIEENNIGKGKINYRLRDAVFGRQRYWGEPIPIYYKDGIPYTVEEKDLPIVLPEVDKYLPTEDGEPPLAHAEKWKYKNEFEFEKTTMPGWAGSSWYFLRYMDPHNEIGIAAKEKLEYWKDIDLYVGGAEHATGHLLYFRFWTKFLKDIGYISIEEPAKKLINQGMIQGSSRIIFRINPFYSWEPNGDIKCIYPIIFVSKSFADKIRSNKLDEINREKIIKKCVESFKRNNPELKLVDFNSDLSISDLRIDVNIVDGIELNIDKFKDWLSEYSYSEFISEDDGRFICGEEVEKMSKSKWNVVNPDDLCERYGADTLRCYEMFLGPLTDHKPWDTKGIEGTYRFLKKLWRLFDNIETTVGASKAEHKALHKCIKRVNEDLERYSFNTVVSTFMICVNELTDLKCYKKEILEPLVVLISPYAPHIAEEIWEKLGNTSGISRAIWPKLDESYLVEDSINYPVQFNGKMRFTLELAASLSQAEIEKEVMANEQTHKYLEGKSPKRVIIVPKKIVNIVV